MLAVDDVKFEGVCVKEVVDVLATAGLAAHQHLAGIPITLIEKLVHTCSVAAGGVEGTNPAPHIHEQMASSNYVQMATTLRTPLRITTSRLSTMR